MKTTNESASEEEANDTHTAEDTTTISIDNEAVSQRVVPESSLLFPENWESIHIERDELIEGFEMATQKKESDGLTYFPVVDSDVDSSSITLGEPVHIADMIFNNTEYIAVQDMVHDAEAAKYPCKLNEMLDWKQENETGAKNSDSMTDEDRERFETKFADMLNEWIQDLPEQLKSGIEF